MLSFRRAGSGKPLIMIHGFLGGAEVWLSQQIGFKQIFDVVAVDLPGFAGSPIGNAPNTMQGFVAEIIALADNLKFDRFSLIGWSFGGMIAQQLALDYPQRVEQLVLAGTAAVGELPHRFETWSQTLSRIKSEGVAATTNRTVRTWFTSGDADPFFQTCLDACKDASEAACHNAINAMQPWSAEERLSEIRSPTLVIVGDRDRSTTPKDSWVLWKGLTSANLCILPGCAHGAHMERPELFNRVTIEFLLGLPPK
jgi:2-hydroxy-6-oxonona-2,4-dienedioate hydrolase